MPEDTDIALSDFAKQLLQKAGFNKLIAISEWSTESYRPKILNRNNEQSLLLQPHKLDSLMANEPK